MGDILRKSQRRFESGAVRGTNGKGQLIASADRFHPGFWQYGSISWSTFSTWLNSLIRTEDDQWAMFDLDEASAADRHGARQQSIDSAITVPPGDYMLRQLL